MSDAMASMFVTLMRKMGVADPSKMMDQFQAVMVDVQHVTRRIEKIEHMQAEILTLLRLRDESAGRMLRLLESETESQAQHKESEHPCPIM